MSEFPDRLRDALDEAELHQADLARFLNVSPAAVSMWLTKDETRRTKPRPKHLRGIANLLRVEYGWLTGESPVSRGESPVSRGESPVSRGESPGLRGTLPHTEKTFREKFLEEVSQAEKLHGDPQAIIRVLSPEGVIHQLLTPELFCPIPTTELIFDYLSTDCAVNIRALPGPWVAGMANVRQGLAKLARLQVHDRSRGDRRRYLLALVPPSGVPRPDLLSREEKQAWNMLRQEVELFDILIGLYPTPESLIQNLVTMERRV